MADKPKLEIVPPADISDLSDLWLDPALGDGLTDTAWHNIPVGKPRDFFQVNPDPAYRRRTEIYTHKPEAQIEEQHFILAGTMRGKIEEARPALIVTCIYRDGTPRLWPLKFPRLDERENEAWSSARSAARDAMAKWIRIVWVRRAYIVRTAHEGYAPDPDWSKLPTFDQLVTIAFGPNEIIRDPNHQAYRDLMGVAPRRADDDDL